MILFFNVFITPGNLKHSYNRGGLPKEDNFDIFKFCISSISKLNYPWSSILLNIKLDSCYLHRQEELHNWIKDCFPNQEYTLNLGYRCENQKQWQGVINNFKDELVFCSCNHDHIFVGSPDYFVQCIDTVKKYEKEVAMFAVTHFPDYIPLCKNRDYEIDGPVFITNTPETGSFSIVTKALLKKWWFEVDFGNAFLPRSDWEGDLVARNVKDALFFCGFKELFRHIDGYHNIAAPTSYHMKYFPPFTIANPPKQKTVAEIEECLAFYLTKDSPEYHHFLQVNKEHLESLRG